MLILRLIAILAVISVVAGFALYLLTGKKSYLTFSWVVLKAGIGAGLIIFVLLFAERLLVLPI